MRAEVEEASELPDLLDLDLGARLRAPGGRLRRFVRIAGGFSRERLGLQAPEVGMAAGGEPATTLAAPARPVRWVFAQQEAAPCARRAPACRCRVRRGSAGRAGSGRRAPSALRRGLVPGMNHEPSGKKQRPLQAFADTRHVRGGVDDRSARARRGRARGRRPARARRRPPPPARTSSFFPRLARRCAPRRSGSRTRACGRGRAGMRRVAQPLDQSRAHAVAGALVGVGRVGEAVADHPAARSERGADHLAHVVARAPRTSAASRHRRPAAPRGARAAARRVRCRRARA